MKTNRIILIAGIVVFLLTQSKINSTAQVAYKPNKQFIEGGQFKDLFLPVPIQQKLISDNIWGGENVLPRDAANGVEDNEWSYWGGNPVEGTDGEFHIAICRWKEETGHWGWPKSEVAHAISKQAAGPYKITGTILEKGHNPEVIQLKGGNFILHISGGNIYSSKKMTGPWNLLGKIEINTRGHKGLSHLYTNLTGLERDDGSFLFFTKRGDVMISNTGLLGPYEIVSAHNYNRYSGYPEDPVIWKSLHQYHVVYNHAVEKKSVYMRSLDGINWIVEPGLAYDNSIFKYTDGTHNEWVKFERPKVLQDELGRATHLSLGVIDVEKHLDLGNDKHSSKNVIMPLSVERLVEIENTKPINTATKEVKVRIKAEVGFDSKNSVDVNSLILGTSNKVNVGEGAKAIKSEVENGDLLVTFNWQGVELSGNYYDLKLLGKTKNGEIVYGYALLPEYSENPASLVTLPLKIEENILLTEVENFGLQNSLPCKLRIFKNEDQKRELIKDFDIPALNSYETFKIEFPTVDCGNCEFEAVIVRSEDDLNFWNKVDENHYTVDLKGEWIANKEGKNIYMGTEQVAHQKDASATFFFSGTQARCYGNISKKMGSCDIYIDDNYIETIDCYFGADLNNMVIYQTEILPAGLHKLELRVTGKHYKGNKNGPVSIDAFSYRN